VSGNIKLVLVILAIVVLAGCNTAMQMVQPEPAFAAIYNDSKLPATSVRSIFYTIRRIEIWNYGDDVTGPVWSADMDVTVGAYGEYQATFPSGIHFIKIFVGEPSNAGEFNPNVQTEAVELNTVEISSAFNFEAGKMYIIKFDSHKEIVGTSLWSDLIMTIEVSKYE